MASEGAVPSLTSTAKDLLKNQGVGGLYRGLEANIARVSLFGLVFICALSDE